MNAALQDRIAQFRKMAQDDPENELGHFSLGKALFEDAQFVDAAVAFQKTVELNPQISKAYQLLGQSLISAGNPAGAIAYLTKGFEIADERGENMPRDEMAKLLKQVGAEVPASKRAAGPKIEGVGGFACQRPGCMAGPRAVQLQRPPMSDELGQQVYNSICAECWQEWLGQGVKVINELRLDLSDEKGQQTYDEHMRDFLGI